MLQAHYDQGVAAGRIDPAAAERMATYAEHLEAAGYTVYATAAEGYVCLVTGAC